MTKNNLPKLIAKLENLMEEFTADNAEQHSEEASKVLNYIIQNIEPKDEQEYLQVREIMEWWRDQASNQIKKLKKEEKSLINNSQKMYNYTKTKHL